MKEKRLLFISVLSIIFFVIFGFISCSDSGFNDANNQGNGDDPKPGMDSVYYVSKDGDNNNSGTKNSPWRTIQKAAETLRAGDTVYIRGGTYKENIITKYSGSSGKYITYSAYENEQVNIDGKNIELPDTWSGLIFVNKKSYIKFSGLRILNAGSSGNHAGILIDYSNHIIIENNYIYNSVSSGIGVWDSENIVIDGNEVELACDDGEQECITVAGTNNFEIKNNLVHHGGPGSIGGEGIDAKDGSSNGKIYKNTVHHVNRLGIYVDSWDKHTFNIKVYQNIVYLCEGEGFAVASEAGGLLENINIYNNIAYKNKYTGITVAGWGEAKVEKHSIKNIRIINNTFYKNGRGDWGGGISIENNDI